MAIGRDEEQLDNRATEDAGKLPTLESMETDLPSLAKQLKALDRADIKNWLRRGELLTQARELNASDDAFRTWLRENALAKTTAYDSMAAWRNFGDCPDSGQFTKEAMTCLAKNAHAREEAMELASSKKITRAVAKQLLAKHGPPADAVTLTEEKTSGFRRVIQVEDCYVVVKGPTFQTPSDLLAILVNATRQLREEVSSGNASDPFIAPAPRRSAA